jgi:hypothetical protein
LTDAQAAKLMAVSERSVERAKQVMRTDPEAHAKAKAGTLGRANRSKIAARIGSSRSNPKHSKPYEERRIYAVGKRQAGWHFSSSFMTSSVAPAPAATAVGRA